MNLHRWVIYFLITTLSHNAFAQCNVRSYETQIETRDHANININISDQCVVHVINSELVSQRSQLIAILKIRADAIVYELDSYIKKIDESLYRVSIKYPSWGHISDVKPHSDLDKTNAEITNYASRESWNLNQKLRNIKERFLLLHNQHINSIATGQILIEREYSNKIISLLTDELNDLTEGNIGFKPGTYFHGYEYILIDVRHVTNLRGRRLTYRP